MPLPPDAANLQYLFRADTGTYSDLGGTTAQVTDGGSVALWKDQSTNKNHLGASVAPTLKTAQINGLPCVRFNGSSQFFHFSNCFIATKRTLYAVIKVPSSGVYTLVCGNNASLQWRIDGNAQRLVKSGVINIGSGAGLVPASTWVQVNVTWDGDTGIFRTSKSADSTVNLSGVYGVNRYVGIGQDASTEWFANDLAVLLEYGVVHTAEERQAVESWITSVWGV